MADYIVLEDIQVSLRNDTSSNWTKNNPVLLKGEMGIEIDTLKFKFGDGTTRWNTLKYAVARDEVLSKTTDPSPSDFDYSIGTIWINTISKIAFMLYNNTVNNAVWKQVVTTEEVLLKSDFASNEKVDEGYVDKAIMADTANTAESADKLTTPVNIGLSGDISGTVSFDGSEDVTIATILANSGVTSGTYTKVTVDAKGRVIVGDNLGVADIPNLTLSKIIDAGTVASKNTGILAGNIPVIGEDGKLDTSILPALAITEVHEANSESAMLDLTAQTGDICVRSDINKSFILKNNDPTDITNWVELKTPDDKVLSVNGRTGVVTLNTDDVSEGSNNLYYTEDRADANFQSHYSTELMDSDDLLRKSVPFIIDCGNSQITESSN